MNANNDASTNPGIISVLNQLNAMFQPAARLASHPGNPPGHDDPEDEPEAEETVCCEGCGEPLDIDSDRCSACQKADWERDDYGMDDHTDRICGNLYDGN